MLSVPPLFATGEFANAVSAFERGDFASAETLLRGLLQEHPDDTSALGLFGAVLDSEKKYAEGGDVYTRALRLSPNSATLLNNFANHQLAIGDTAGARATYLKVIALDPSHANANLQLAIMAVSKKNGAEALRFLNRLPASARPSPQIEILDMEALFLCRREAEANALLTRLLTTTRADPRLNFTAGLALAGVGRYAQAENLFSRALDALPANFDALYNLGLAAYHAGHFDRARDALEAALQQRPHDVDVLFNLAMIQVKLHQQEAALQLLAEASQLDPSRAPVQLALAQTASALGYYADSRLAYASYLKLVPLDSSAQREFDFMVAVSSNPRAGLADLQVFSKAHPQDATALYYIGLLEAQTDPSAAMAHLNRALRLKPDFAPARFGRGVANLLAGNNAAALPDLEFAAAKYPDNAQVLDRLGEAYTALNRSQDAVRVLTKASAIAPRNGRILMHLSRAQMKAGQTVEARATLTRFRAVGPQPGNLIPQPGIVDLLTLSPADQQARYREEVKNRLRKDPQNPALNVRYLETIVDEEGAKNEFAVAVQRVLDSKPLPPQAAEAGHVLILAQQYALAKPLLDCAATTPSPPAGVQLDLAIATFYTAGPQEGLAALEKVPEAERSGDYYLAQAEMLNAIGKPNQALDVLRTALHLDSTQPELYAQAVDFLCKQGRPEEALALLNHASVNLAGDRRLLLLKADTLLELGRAADAERLLKQIQNRWPEWAPSYAEYGKLLQRQNRSEEAAGELEIAKALGAVH